MLYMFNLVIGFIRMNIFVYIYISNCPVGQSPSTFQPCAQSDKTI